MPAVTWPRSLANGRKWTSRCGQHRLSRLLRNVKVFRRTNKLVNSSSKQLKQALWLCTEESRTFPGGKSGFPPGKLPVCPEGAGRWVCRQNKTDRNVISFHKNRRFCGVGAEKMKQKVLVFEVLGFLRNVLVVKWLSRIVLVFTNFSQKNNF